MTYGGMKFAGPTFCQFHRMIIRSVQQTFTTIAAKMIRLKIYLYVCSYILYIFIRHSGRNKKHTRKHATRKIEKKQNSNK